jgi:hypothetical protein
VAELGRAVRAARSASDPRCRGGGEATEASAGLPGRCGRGRDSALMARRVRAQARGGHAEMAR